MKLSGSYFKKMDDFAKWIFGRRRDDNSGNNNKDLASREPQTMKDSSKAYAQFNNECQIQGIKIGADDLAGHPSRTESGNSQRGPISARYVKKTERGSQKGQLSYRQGCTICLDAEANAVLMTCGHGAICFECGLTLLSSSCECHLCRQPVIQVLKIDTTFSHDDFLKVLEAADLHNLSNYQSEALHTSNVLINK